MPTIHRCEWLWAAAWSIVILILAMLPYIYGAAISTPAEQFSGFVIGLEDGNSYLAKMQEGRSGAWLFQLAYTPEPHPGELFFIYYLLLGKMAGWLQWPNAVVFHLSKLATLPLSGLASYFFIAYFSDNERIRRLAFLILGFSGGLGWLWLAAGGSAQLGLMPVDLWVPDASFFLAFLTFAHLPLAQGLLLVFAVTALEFMQTGQKKLGLVAAVCGLVVSLIHPYTLPIIGTVLGLYLIWQFYRRRQVWRSALRLLLVTLPSLPYLIYVLWVFNHNPAFIAWRDQSLTYSPAPVHYLLGFGLTLLLAALGLWITRQQSDDKMQFLRIWLISVPFLLYIPLALQRRFLDGYQAPLAVLAATGLAWLLERKVRQPMRPLVTVITLLGMSLTNVLLLVGAWVTISQHPANVFITGSDVAAAHWLAEQGNSNVMLASYKTGNYLPTMASVRVFVGHGPETVNSDEKQAQVKQFFSSTTSHAWRRDLLAKFNVRYIYYGPNEKAVGGFVPGQAAYLKEVYNNGEVQIFEVKL